MDTNKYILEDILEKLLEISVNYSDKLDKDLQKTLISINELVDTFSELDPSLNELHSYNNSLIELLMNVEHVMSDDDREEFNTYCRQLIVLDKIDILYKGKAVIYENKPYVIHDIDLEDFTANLGDGGLAEYGFDVDLYELI